MSHSPELMAEVAVECARNEIRCQRWGATKQFFSVHKPVLQSGEPKILYTEPAAANADNTLALYFAVEGQKYTFAVDVRVSPGRPEVVWVGCEPRSHVYLEIATEDVDPDQVTALLGLSPTRMRRRGSSRPRGVPYKENLWRLEPQEALPVAIEKKLECLLAMLLPRCDAVKAIAKTYVASIQVVSYQYSGYGQLRGWTLPHEALIQVSKLGVNMNFDLYAFGPELLE